jgi:hypothetical protein
VLRRVRINADATTSAVALIADSTGPKPELLVTARDKGGNSAEGAIAAEWDGGHHLVVVNAVFLEALLAAHPSATCVFRTGKNRGEFRPPLLLEDTEAGVTGTIQPMVPSRVGY